MSIRKLEVYRTAMYVRLSSGDEDRNGINKVDSNSIKNQKLLIARYIEDRPEFHLTQTFVDDGFSGSNFERPSYQKMLEAVINQEIDCIIVKDLSRVAREHVGGDELILRTLERCGVRFIAITDNYDNLTATHSEKHFMVPVKNMLNDTVCADVSMKVRTTQQVKRLNGEFIGVFAPYGYKKSKVNKNQLVIDGYAAGVVQDIFAQKILGMSALAIARGLNERGILSPAEYKKRKGERYSTSFSGSSESQWSAQTIGRILRDEVYTGVLAQGKRTRINHKVKKEIPVPREEWIRVENAHDKVVGDADFNTVQLLIQRDTKASGGGEVYMFAGVLYCGDCGASMVRRVSTYKGEAKISYICSNYNRNGKAYCGRHTINEEVLNEMILNQLQAYVDGMCDSKKVLEHLDKLNINYEKAIAHDREILKLNQELVKYGVLKSSLYPDLQEGIIDREQFAKYREIYAQKEIDINKAIKNQSTMIENVYRNGLTIVKELEEFKQNISLNKLDRIILVTFIDRVLIFENVVEIVFKYSDEMKVVKNIEEVIEVNAKEVG